MVEPVRSKDPIFAVPAGGFPRRRRDRPLDVRLREVHVGARAPSVETSTDGILGGRILLEQPVNGYRTAIDPVLLASVRAGRGERVLDAGLGVGAASLCLAARLDGIDVVGVEIQSESRRPGAQERRGQRTRAPRQRSPARSRIQRLSG